VVVGGEKRQHSATSPQSGYETHRSCLKGTLALSRVWRTVGEEPFRSKFKQDRPSEKKPPALRVPVQGETGNTKMKSHGAVNCEGQEKQIKEAQGVSSTRPSRLETTQSKKNKKEVTAP